MSVERVLSEIQNHHFFKEIPQDVLLRVLNESEVFCLKKGEIVFKQGDESTDFYFNLSGFLRPSLKKINGQVVYLPEIAPQEYFGEMGLLAGHKRALTVQASTNTVLVRISKKIFDNLLVSYPKIYQNIVFSLIQRAQTNLDFIAEKRRRSKHYILISTEKNENLDKFITTVKTQINLSANKSIIFLNLQDFSEKIKAKALDELEQQYEILIWYLESHPSSFEFLHSLLDRVSVIFSVALGKNHVHYSKYHENFFSLHEVKSIRKEIILLWDDRSQISHTKKWLTRHVYELHHHLVDDNDMKRLFRYWKGKSVGVVLGGGGARGWFHFGVLKALQDKNIPIDAIGGTSSGAGVASCFLLANQDVKFAMEMIYGIINSFKDTLRWRHFTYPFISIYDNEPRVRGFKKTYLSKKIEDLPMPYFAVTSNVSTNLEKVLFQGEIWRAVLASSAIPAIFPPVPDEEGLLYDGGLMNNLPVDIMKGCFDGNGTIIASDLSVVDADYSQYHFPNTLSIKKLLFSYFHHKKKYKFPPFMGTILKAFLVGSIDKYYKNIRMADCYIQSKKYNKEIFIFDKKFGLEVFTYGYNVALEKLKKWNPQAECFDD